MDWTIAIGSVTFGLLDVIALAVVLIGAISGCITGFTKKAGKLAAFLLAMPAAVLFTKQLGTVIADNSSLSIFSSTLIAFVGLSAVFYTLLFIFVSQLSNIVESSGTLRAIDSIIGFALGLLCSALVLSALIYFLQYQTFFDMSALTENSIVFKRIIQPLYPQVAGIFSGAVNAI